MKKPPFSSLSLGITLLVSSSALNAWANNPSVCNGHLPTAPQDFGKYDAYSCELPENFSVCMIQWKRKPNDSTQIIYPKFVGEGGITQTVETPTRNFQYFHEWCVETSGSNIPFYDEAYCSKWAKQWTKFEFDQNLTQAKVQYTFEAKKKRDNVSKTYEGKCVRDDAADDLHVQALKNKLVKTPTGELEIVKSHDPKTETVQLENLKSGASSQLTYAELKKTSTLQWEQIGPHAHFDIIPASVLTGGSFDCLVSMENSPLDASFGKATLSFRTLTRTVNDLGLTSSAQLNLLNDFTGRKALPNGGNSETLYDSDKTTVILRKLPGGVEYVTPLFIDRSQLGAALGIQRDVFVLPGVVCFR